MGADGEYQVLRLIGAGGTAEVFEARSGQVRVAIKRFFPGVCDDDFVAQFLEEAEGQLSLTHQNILRVLDFGITEGRAFMVMELVDGHDLFALEEIAGQQGETFPPEVALFIAAEISEALDYVHHALDDAGRPAPLLHGDISPENVMVSWNGDVRVTDFGLSLGRKRAFAPPELELSPAADVYAIGATLRWMMGDETTPEVEALLQAVMSERPEARPSAAAFAADLRSIRGAADRASLRAWLDKVRLARPQGTPSAPAVQLFAIPNLITQARGGTAEPRAPKTRVRAPFAATPLPVSPPPSVESTSLIGTVLHGFRVESLIVGGRTANVYAARHLHLDRAYAVKVIHPGVAADPKALDRFKIEAQLLSKLDHPNVVRVADFGTTAEGAPFLAMDRAEGPTLAQIVEQQGPLPLVRVVSIAAQVAAALDAIHALGLVHRELQPGNLVVNDAGQVKLIGFRFVRIAGVDARDRLTATGQIVGAPGYMAPEQIVGAKDVGPAADLYAFGALLHFLLSGTPPFGSQPLVAMNGHLHGVPPPLPTAAGLEPLVRALLAKRVEGRPATAGEVLTRLAAPATHRRSSLAPVLWLAALAVVTIWLGWMTFGPATTTRTPLPTPTPMPTPTPTASPATAPEPARIEALRVIPRLAEPSPPPFGKTRARVVTAPAPPSEPVPAPEAVPDYEDLKHSLSAVRERIGRLEPASQPELDRRYLDLRSELRPDLGEKERRRLALSITALAGDVEVRLDPKQADRPRD